MKRILVLALAFGILAGCSENKLKIVNYSDLDVFFNFRAEKHYVAAYDSTSVSDIPNGTYIYGTIYSLTDPNRSITEGDGLTGDMTFERSETSMLITYGIGGSADSSEVLWAVVSSDQPTGAIVAP